MTPFWKIAGPVTSVALISAAAVFWPIYQRVATERKFAKDAQAYRVRAEQGDATAQYRLGNRYRRGEGVTRDYGDALRWYRKAADQGDANAQYGIGFMYRNGQGVPRDDAEAVLWLRKSADQGYALAQDVLGLMYSRGEGLSRDVGEALRWNQKAAEQNYAPAQRALGFIYFYGRGVPQDDAESLRWFRKAAAGGDTLAQARLAVSYFKGQGAPRNYIESSRWFGKLAISCVEKLYGGTLGRWMSIIAILALLVILAVPQRRLGRFIWVPWALLFAALATQVDRELLAGRMPWFGVFAVFATLSAILTIELGVEAARRSKWGSDQGQPHC
jgi:Sel1 repeat